MAWTSANGTFLAASSSLTAITARRPSRLRRALLWLIALATAAYLVIVALVYFRQENLIFHPVPLAADFQFSLPGVVEEKVIVPGAELSALHLRLPNPN